MKILVSGSTGFVGSALQTVLTARRHQVVALVRGVTETDGASVHWDPLTGSLDHKQLEGIDAVVHLAGENVAGGRWNPARKERIRASRVEGTRLLASKLGQLERPPAVAVCASAIGYYGSRADAVMTEESTPGSGFLAEVTQEWEKATEPMSDSGIRVVNMRIGVVLSPIGAALERMLLPFRLGLGGRVGNGHQYMSWITLEDVVDAISFALGNDSLHGPVNTVAPGSVTNRHFTRALGHAVRRPALLPLPAWFVRLAMGEMGEDLLLSSTRVEPVRLQHAGYEFHHPTIESALEHML